MAAAATQAAANNVGNFSCHSTDRIPSAAAASSTQYGARNNSIAQYVRPHILRLRRGRELLSKIDVAQCNLRSAPASSSTSAASHADQRFISTAQCSNGGATSPAAAPPSPKMQISTVAAAVSAPISSTAHLKHERNNNIIDACTENVPSPPGLETAVASLEEWCRNSPPWQLAARWREYHGSQDWRGLLEPLDANLRREILKYGDLTQLTYDAFDSDPDSSNCGNAVCPDPAFLLRQAGLSHTGYEITRYLYATSDVHLPAWLLRGRAAASSTWSRDSNWMGFVAVATDEAEVARLGRRDIVVAWRGTVTPLEWMEDFDSKLVDPEHGRPLAAAAAGPQQQPTVGVEHGFWTLFTCAKAHSRYNKASAAQQVREEVARLLASHSGDDLPASITVTGHSLGGALATLCAYDLASSGVINRPCGDATPISVVSFAAPRAGNAAFAARLEELGVHVLRIVNTHDFVPKVPGLFLNEGLAHLDLPFHRCHYHHLRTAPPLPAHAYSHAGVQLTLDHTRSPFLKKWASLPDCHNLEVHLHLVDGYRSTREPFTSEVTKLQRNLALVNKTSGLLVESLDVPAWWWAEKAHDRVNKPLSYIKLPRPPVERTEYALPPSPNSMQMMTA